MKRFLSPSKKSDLSDLSNSEWEDDVGFQEDEITPATPSASDGKRRRRYSRESETGDESDHHSARSQPSPVGQASGTNPSGGASASASTDRVGQGQPESTRVPCSYCNSTFASRGNLQRHVQNMHGANERNRCEECGSSFSSKFNLNRHVDNVHRRNVSFLCDRCDQSFTAKESLERHVVEVHRGIVPYKCQLCQEAFARKSHLKDHMRTIHGIQ